MMIKTGIIGFILTAICCVTPVLVWVFGSIGLSALIVGVDPVLFALLGLFAILIVAGLVQKQVKSGQADPLEEDKQS